MNRYETVVSIVKDYGEYLEFAYEWYGYSFAQLSYSKWAVNEVLKRLRVKKGSAPLVVIEEFRDMMSEYSHMNSKTSLIFLAACDVANDIIDHLL